MLNPVTTGSSPIPGVDDMIGEYRRGVALIVIPVCPPGADVAGDAGTTLHLPFTHPQLPAPQSIGPSQLAVHSRLQTRFAGPAMQLDGWQHSAGTQSASLMHSATCTGDAVAAGVAGDNETGTVGVPTGSGECVVHPATAIAAMQMTRRAITFRSIQKAWMQDFIKKMVTFEYYRTGKNRYTQQGRKKFRYFIDRSYRGLVSQGNFYTTEYRMVDPMTAPFPLYRRGTIAICLVALLGLMLLVSGCTQPAAQQQQKAPAPVTATRTDSSHITITYPGSTDTGTLLELEVTVTDSAGKTQTRSLGDRYSTTPLKFGTTRTFSGTFNGNDHVLVTGYFMDGSQKPVLDTTF